MIIKPINLNKGTLYQRKEKQLMIFIINLYVS